MLSAFLKPVEIEEWCEVVMDFLLEADDLLVPSNLMEALKNAFTMHYCDASLWETLANRLLAVDEASPGVSYGDRPSIMKILNGWENTPELAQIFKGMRVTISKRDGSYSAMSYAERVAVS